MSAPPKAEFSSLRLRDKFVFVLISALLQIIVFSPQSFYGCYGQIFYFGMRFFARKEVNQLFLNLEKILKLPSHSGVAKRFARQVLRNQIFCALETLRIFYRPTTKHTVAGTQEFFSAVKKLQKQDKGMIFISAHLGSWEMAAKIAAQSFDGLHVLAKPSRNPAASLFLQNVRNKIGAQVLWSNAKSILKDMLKVMQAKQSLGFVMDQKPEGRVGERLSFLGAEAEFVAGPELIAQRTEAPVIAIFCVRERAWQYRFIFEPVPPKTKNMVEAMEKVINLYPESWTWNYKRWKFT